MAVLTEHRFQKLFNDEIKEREMAELARQQEMKEKVMPEKGLKAEWGFGICICSQFVGVHGRPWAMRIKITTNKA